MNMNMKFKKVASVPRDGKFFYTCAKTSIQQDWNTEKWHVFTYDEEFKPASHGSVSQGFKTHKEALRHADKISKQD